MRLYIFSGARALFYQQVNNSSFILSSLELSLHYMGDEYESEYIIGRKQKCLMEIRNKGQIHFFHDILMGHDKEKNKKTQLLY